MNTVLTDIDFNERHIDNAFEDVYSLLVGINMKEEADNLYTDLTAALTSDNPFVSFYKGTHERTPTDKVIHIIYDLAAAKIMKKFPEAYVKYSVDGYNSTFNVDDDTYKKGDAERWADYE